MTHTITAALASDVRTICSDAISPGTFARDQVRAVAQRVEVVSRKEVRSYSPGRLI